MLSIGITGDSGSGKSYICKLFEDKGVPIYNCDKRSKYLLISNFDLIEKIKKEFGNNIYDGNIYKNLSNIVFINNPEKLPKLTSLIYPYLFEDRDKFYEENKNASFCLVESAILFENKMEESLDGVIYVYCCEDIRIKRVIERDGITKEEYKNRMKNQIPVREKIDKSQYLIINEGMNNVEDRVNEICKTIINL